MPLNATSGRWSLAVELRRGQQLSDVSAKLLLYLAFVEAALDVPRHLATDVHSLYFNPQEEEFAPRRLLEPVERVHERVQGSRSETAIQGNRQAWRLPERHRDRVIERRGPMPKIICKHCYVIQPLAVKSKCVSCGNPLYSAATVAPLKVPTEADLRQYQDWLAENNGAGKLPEGAR
jgi:hypothetical protein